jgi:signal transduction histidine kinase
MKNSELQNTQREILANEKLLRLATEASRVGVWKLDLLTNEIQRNIFHDQAFGYDDLQPFWNVVNFKKHLLPEDLNEIIPRMVHAIACDKGFQMEFRVLWPDQTLHWLSVSAKLDLNHLVGTVMDVTEKKKMEEALREALFYRDEFLSIASHELKTPLTSLKLQSQLFKRMIARNDPESYKPGRVERLIDQTDRQVSRLVGLVDDMLDISRIRTGKLTLNKEPVQLDELLQLVVDRFSSQFAIKEAPTVHITQLDQVLCPCDRIRIEQVLFNLLKNSFRYGNGKPVKISLVKEAEMIRISVEDHGIGIAKKNLQQIFNRFKRAIPATEVSGLGLGLFIAKQILLAHNGDIEVQSELGKGSIFSLVLPLRSGVE